jgi:hypothetical protein
MFCSSHPCFSMCLSRTPFYNVKPSIPTAFISSWPLFLIRQSTVFYSIYSAPFSFYSDIYSILFPLLPFSFPICIFFKLGFLPITLVSWCILFSFLLSLSFSSHGFLSAISIFCLAFIPISPCLFLVCTVCFSACIILLYRLISIQY